MSGFQSASVGKGKALTRSAVAASSLAEPLPEESPSTVTVYFGTAGSLTRRWWHPPEQPRQAVGPNLQGSRSTWIAGLDLKSG